MYFILCYRYFACLLGLYGATTSQPLYSVLSDDTNITCLQKQLALCFFPLYGSGSRMAGGAVFSVSVSVSVLCLCLCLCLSVSLTMSTRAM